MPKSKKYNQPIIEESVIQIPYDSVFKISKETETKYKPEIKLSIFIKADEKMLLRTTLLRVCCLFKKGILYKAWPLKRFFKTNNCDLV